MTIEAYLTYHLKTLENDKTIQRWAEFVCDFFDCYDRENNVYRHLPLSGGYYEQDDFFFVIWQTIRNIYNELMADTAFLDRLEKRKQFLRKRYNKDK